MMSNEAKIIRLLLSLGLFLTVLNFGATQSIGLGRCPEVEVVQNFQQRSYLGNWYEYARYPNWFEIGATCVKAEYLPSFLRNEEENKLNEVSGNEKKTDRDVYYPLTVKNLAVRRLFHYKKDTSVTGMARFADPSTEDAKLLVNFNGKEGPYWVLSTDYTSYSVVYSCLDLHVFHLKFVWLLTREREPSADTITTLEEKVKSFEISKHYLEKTKQTECE